MEIQCSFIYNVNFLKLCMWLFRWGYNLVVQFIKLFCQIIKKKKCWIKTKEYNQGKINENITLNIIINKQA